ncbi:MAG: peptidylprolyl isomerase [Pseudomonadota bacterium]
MNISENKVVSIYYTLTNDAGELLDQSTENEPLQYLHGYGNLIVGLEKALDGRKPGDKFEARIAAQEAYGEFDEALLQDVPLEAFEQVEDLQVGMQFQAEDNEGENVIVTVKEIQDKHVVIDSNHPLAGVDLNFVVEVTDIREATPEEIESGHLQH